MIKFSEQKYNLESRGEIMIEKILLHDTYGSLTLANNRRVYNVAECIELIESIKSRLESSTSKGFLPSVDLTKFPIVADLLQPFLQGSESEVKPYITGNKTMETYKWIYNIIILILYLTCLESIGGTNSIESDELIELKCLEKDLYGRLDPSIRCYIQKKGINIKQNTYIGFDTEFTKKDLEFNTLVSAQLAVTTKTYVKIPTSKGYQMSQLDENSNSLIPVNTSSTVLNYTKIENSIKMFIAEVRGIKYSKHDESILVLTETLKMIKGLKYTERSDHILFALPWTVIQPYIKYGNTYSLRELIQTASGLAKSYHLQSYSLLIQLIKEISISELSLLSLDKLKDKVQSSYADYSGIEEIGVEFDKPLALIADEEICEDLNEKRLTRQFYTDIFPQKVSVTQTRAYYLIAHLTQADLSMLSDFEKIKEELSIVNGSFVTLGQPFKYYGRNIHIRDTMLLAPGASKSLASIGRLYGDVLKKVEISKSDLEDMQGFLQRDKAKFTEYALKDALISLIHAAWMEDFNFNIGGVGIPLSLSSLGRSYVKHQWREESYGGYQISNKYLLGEAASSITPKGLNVLNKIGFVLPYYTANYKGGRNECFMFGLDRETYWFDYDLSNAYTTVMSMAGHPDYESCRRLTKSELKGMCKDEILYSYLIIQADFEFPADVKYPSIPCFVDENCTVYPLKGTCVITGAEYLLALSQKCVFKLNDIYYISFKKSEYKEHKPFSSILSVVQEQRREHLKGTISNLIYKEIGNGIYGSVVRGIGNKRKFDIKSKGMVRMLGDDLTNPLIASWTTAFVRSVIGECLDSIQKIGGLVVSVTTDGFITNLAELENKISSKYLFLEFKKIRKILAGEDKALELKSEGKGVIAWSTRGQIGIESKIIATTGLQHRVYRSKQEMVRSFVEIVKSEDKTIEFVQSRLRSASDIYKKGGNVTMVYRDQLFRMHYDNRRLLEWETTIPATIEKLVDSKPLEDINQGKNLRYISQLSKRKLYGKYISSGKALNSYGSKVEIAVRNFLKGLLSTPPKFNLNRNDFFTYCSIVEFIKSFNSEIKITESELALMQHRVKKVRWIPMEKTKDNEKFVCYIQRKFPDFDVESYYGENDVK